MLLASAVRPHDHLAHVLMEALGRLGESRLRARPICLLLSPACPRCQNNESPLRLAVCGKLVAHYRGSFLSKIVSSFAIVAEEADLAVYILLQQ